MGLGTGDSNIVSAPARIIVRLMLTTSLSVMNFGCVSLAPRKLSRRSLTSLVSKSFLVLYSLILSLMSLPTKRPSGKVPAW